MTQRHHFLTSYPRVSLSSCKAQDSFCATPLCSSQYHQDYSRMIPALSGTFKSSLQFLPYTFKHVQFSALLENVLLTQMPSLAAAIYFFSFYCQTFQFSNKQPISAASIFSPDISWNQASILITLQKKNFPSSSNHYYGLFRLDGHLISSLSPSPFLLYPEPGLFYFLSLIQSPFFLSRIFIAP